ncbi:uncharacterized protein K02A2.6-like [Scophthalmus maximus]|uniref:uncharacterized protein K02A2.6-like n=1 Tax=Scophthalmus maximus TaxID=52904 RepID=UPI001FA866BD|nr:uncharacterized protein K02A2.6-like [Scophthalmus maximus]XP_047189550.1 uncharacterized protein K02A2.6-like [Scophthalmus maximus]XP_047189551.1 uncharacterized protein K02A2.6-like [Scophthalmus maximus]
MQRGSWNTSTGNPVKHQQEVQQLAEAIMQPKEPAIIKFAAHQKGTDPVSRGNEAADAAAKQAAGYTNTASNIMILGEQNEPMSCTLSDVSSMQEKAGVYEQNQWVRFGAKKGQDSLWRLAQGKVVLPCKLFDIVVKEAHGYAHNSQANTARKLDFWWHPFLPQMVADFVKTCTTCQKYTPKPSLKPPMGQCPVTHMGPQNRTQGYRYLLVIADAYSGWIEAVPTKGEDAASVIKALMNMQIPRHGFPSQVRSDNGSHFKNTDLQTVEKAYGIMHTFGTVYHPQSQGKVERANGVVKQKLAKITSVTGMSWVDALPIALLETRSSPHSETGLSPYQLQTGRLFREATGEPTPQQCEELPLIQWVHPHYWNTVTQAVASLQTQVRSLRPQPENAGLDTDVQ